MNLLQRSNVVYPVAIGSCIVFFFFYCGIFRKERHELIETAAIMILIAGVLLLAFPA
jgi:multidrug transporter EmrE-like cation transporter